MYDAWKNEGIDIITKRSFTISNLVFQLFYVDAKLGDPFHLAPTKLQDPLSHYICENAVVGGYTCSHGHGHFDKNTIINEHLNTQAHILPSGDAWPNYELLQDQKITFDKKCNFIHSYDVRSQYPAAAMEPNPVGPPLIINTIHKNSGPMNLWKKKLINVSSFCSEVQHSTDQTFIAQQLNGKEFLYKSEYYAVRHYLRTKIPENAKIVRVSSSSHCAGQMSVGNFFMDLHITYSHNDTFTVILMNYNSYFNHGCMQKCSVYVPDRQREKRHQTKENIKKIEAITQLWMATAKKWKLISNESQLVVKFEELTDCNFLHKPLINFVPEEDVLLSDQPFLKHSNYLSYNKYLKHIYEGRLQGFIGNI